MSIRTAVATLATLPVLAATLLTSAPASADPYVGRGGYYTHGGSGTHWRPPVRHPNWNRGPIVRPYYGYYRPPVVVRPAPPVYWAPPAPVYAPACWYETKKYWVDTYYGPQLRTKRVEVCR